MHSYPKQYCAWVSQNLVIAAGNSDTAEVEVRTETNYFFIFYCSILQKCVVDVPFPVYTSPTTGLIDMHEETHAFCNSKQFWGSVTVNFAFELQTIITQGADIEAQNEHQFTSLMLAAVNGCLSLMEVRSHLESSLFNILRNKRMSSFISRR